MRHFIIVNFITPLAPILVSDVYLQKPLYIALSHI